MQSDEAKPVMGVWDGGLWLVFDQEGKEIEVHFTWEEFFDWFRVVSMGLGGITDSSIKERIDSIWGKFNGRSELRIADIIDKIEARRNPPRL